MFEKKIKTLIVGLGNIGFKYDLNLDIKNYYTTHAKSIYKISDFHLVGGVDKNLKSREVFKKEYKKITYDKIDNAIKTEKPDLVVISTNEKYHLNIVKKISYFNFVKFIVLEKPAGRNSNDLKKILNICKKNNKKLLINYFRLYNPYFKKIIANLRNQKIFASFQYNRGLRNNCSHLISFLFSIQNPEKLSKIKINFISNSQNKVISLKWNKIHCLIVNPAVKNLSHTKVEIFSKRKHLISNNDFSEFKIGNLVKSKFIKKFYEFENYFTHENKHKKTYQKVFYENFKKNVKECNKYNKIFLITSKLLDKLVKLEKRKIKK